MPDNRFDFLEFGEQPDSETSLPDSPPGSAPEAPEATAPTEGQPTPNMRLPDYASPRYRPTTRPIENPGEAPRGVVTYHELLPAATSSDRLEIRAAEVFGKRGSAAGEFNYPAGVAVDSAGILFVADVYNHRVQRITPDGGVGLVGTRGSGRTQFLAPSAIAVDADRSFYVVEQGNHRFQKFSAEGLLQMVVGRQGSKSGEFRSPMGICVSPATREIFVADTGNGRVQRFTCAGEYLGSLGAAGSLQPALVNPQSVTCDDQGNIYVADTLSNRVARYDPLGRFTGHYGGVIGTALTTLAPNVRFTEPRALACNQRGELFISEGGAGPCRIVALGRTGDVLAVIDDPGHGLGRLAGPSGIAFAPRLRTGFADGVLRADLYVADTMNHRIIRFACT